MNIALDDLRRIGRELRREAQAFLVGHRLECAGQVTGGYVADPGVKDIPGLARLGFPIGDVREDGVAVVTKVAGSGGAVTARTVKEQLLYEIQNPKAYLQPDVIADFSEVRVEEMGPNPVCVTGGKGAPKTGLLKTSVGYVDSYVGEGQFSYAGPNAATRARLALDIVRPAGQITKVGWGPQPLNFSLDPLVQKAVTLQGSFSHNWPIWEKVLSLLASGKIDLDPILNRVSPITEWKDVFDQMHSGNIVKGVLKP